MTTAIYARISRDADQRGLGVARQLEDCRALAERRSWADVEEYVDNDVSASTSRVRPQYARLLSDIGAGKVSALVVWDIDRLTRKPVELEEVIALADVHGLALASVGGEVDLATPQGRLTARIKGSVARHEAEQMSRRIRRKVEELAAAGMPHSGGRRPFGYDVTRMGVVEEEAALIQDAAARVLAGASLRSIVREWNGRGVLSVMGLAWTVQALRGVLVAPRTAGLVELRGKVVGQAQWPAILDLETHEALRHVILDPARRRVGVGRPRAHWWTGLVYCGRCGKRMENNGGAARRQMRCRTDDGGCGRTMIELKHLLPIMRTAVLSHVSDLAVRPSNATETQARAQVLDAAVDAAEGRLEGLAAAFAEEGDPQDYVAASKALRKRLKELREERAALTVDAAEKVAAAGIAERAANFANLDVEQQADVARLVVDRFVVGPGTPGRFRPERVQVDWNFSAGPVDEE